EASSRPRTGPGRAADPHQRGHSRPAGAADRRRRRADRHQEPRRGARVRLGEEPRPGRGRSRGPSARLPGDGLLEVQVRAGAEGEAGAQAPEHHHDQGDQAAAEGRPARLRDEEGPRRPLPAEPRQGQGHDHVPRARDDPSGAWAQPAAAAGHGAQGDRRDRVRAAPGRPEHGDDAGAGQGADRASCGRRPSGRRGRAQWRRRRADERHPGRPGRGAHCRAGGDRRDV
ncbi:MAG: Translation initiation factor 3, partial [uncultured Thermoleophilia bacterium]